MHKMFTQFLLKVYSLRSIINYSKGGSMGIIYELYTYANDRDENSRLHATELLQSYLSVNKFEKLEMMHCSKTTSSSKKRVS